MSKGAGATGARALSWWLAILAALVAVSAVVPTAAQDRDILVRALRQGRDFRVRVQAAFALGDTQDGAVRVHLERALSDDSNPAVRAAAATALGRLGSHRALAALRRAAGDPSASVRMQVARSIRVLTERRLPVEASRTARLGAGLRPTYAIAPSDGTIPWDRVQYAVWVGNMNNESGFAGKDLASRLKGEVERRLRLLRGVAVFTDDDSLGRDAQRQIERHRVPKLRVEGNVRRVQRRRHARDMSVRCEVSLVLLDEPERNMRGMLTGAATGTEPRKRDPRNQERRLAEQALEGAVRSAMTNAAQALAQAGNR